MKAKMFKKSVFERLIHVQHILVLWKLQNMWVYDYGYLFLTELVTVYFILHSLIF